MTSVQSLPRETPTSQGRVVIISAFQDYRSRKRASIQQVADGLVDAGYDVTFISTRFSNLSKRTGDSRLFLESKANTVEVVNGVRCYLWKTAVHPFGSSRALIKAAMVPAYYAFANLPNQTFDDLVREANYIVVESGVAVIYLARLRRLNPAARIIYYAADRLDTVGAHPYVQRQLEKAAGTIHHVCLRSSAMKDGFGWAKDRLFKAEYGINKEDFAAVENSPYPPGRHAVSVGSMLFDKNYFVAVAEHFRDVTFHVIGCGTIFDAPENVRIYPEMRFIDTLAYLQHATVGVAPYQNGVGVEYLAESSLKLAQYEYLGLPAVCPSFAVGDRPSRYGYDPALPTSMIAATQEALSNAGTIERREFPTWKEVAMRMLHPALHPPSRIT